MKTAQLPPLLIFCIGAIWSQTGLLSSGKQLGHNDGNIPGKDEHRSADGSSTMRSNSNQTTDAPGGKKNEKKKNKIDICQEERGICGDNGRCHSRPNGYYCICTGGNKQPKNPRPCLDLSCPFEQNDSIAEECPSMKAGRMTDQIKEKDGNPFFGSICNWASNINDKCHTYKDENDTSELSVMNVSLNVNHLIQNTSEWKKMEKGERQKAAALLLDCMESTVIVTAAKMNKQKYNLETTNLGLQVQLLQSKNISINGTVTLLAKGNKMDFNWEMKNREGFAAVSLIAYTEMESILDVDDLEMENKKYGTEYLQLNSDVLTATMTGNNQTVQNIRFIIKNKQDCKIDDFEDYTICAYWYERGSRKFWSTSGCNKVSSNLTHTTCNCRHLSNFAVLVALYKVEGPGLNTITYIGISISLVGLFIAIVTFVKCRAIQGTRNTIHTHLCLNLFVAELLFLIGISATGNTAVCGAIAGILHYLFLACFMWMLLEGVQLYLMVVKVFLTQSLRGKYTYPIAYGIPALIVIVSASVNSKGYGTREYCWLTIENGFRWSFVGPLCVICLVNLVFLSLTIWKLAQKFNTINPDLPYLQKIRMFIVTAVAQLVLLGCTWIFGIFHFQDRTIALAYIFTIINSFQGLLIFILHCVINKQVRDEYRRWIARFCTAMKIPKYSVFSESSRPTSSSHVAASNTSV